MPGLSDASTDDIARWTVVTIAHYLSAPLKSSISAYDEILETDCITCRDPRDLDLFS